MDNGKMFPLGSRTTLFSRKEPKASRIEEAQLNLCNYKKKKLGRAYLQEESSAGSRYIGYGC
jgi:hypothetical protein